MKAKVKKTGVRGAREAALALPFSFPREDFNPKTVSPVVRKRKRFRNEEVNSICRRILEDLDELYARVLVNKDSLEEMKSLANSNGDNDWEDGLCKALAAFHKGEPNIAASAISFLAQKAALALERLTYARPEILKVIARKSAAWPINLSMTRTGKVQGSKFAASQLKDMEVNKESIWPSDASPRKIPYRIAAERTYQNLLMMKRDQKTFFRRKTPWLRALLELNEPMTKESSLKWWKVAKEYLDEAWELDQVNWKIKPSEGNGVSKASVFYELIKLYERSKASNPSELQRNVIDLHLRSAFLHLV